MLRGGATGDELRSLPAPEIDRDRNPGVGGYSGRLRAVPGRSAEPRHQRADQRAAGPVHVLRPAIIPVIASVGAGFGIMLGSAAIIDQVFALNGIGQALLTAVKQGDLMVVMGAVLVAVILISLVNLIADICQAVLDPRAHMTLCGFAVVVLESLHQIWLELGWVQAEAFGGRSDCFGEGFVGRLRFGVQFLKRPDGTVIRVLLLHPDRPRVVNIRRGDVCTFDKGKKRIEAEQGPGVPIWQQIRRNPLFYFGRQLVEVSHRITRRRMSAK
jgi:hypothetical protein